MITTQDRWKNELYANNKGMAVFWSILIHVSVFVIATLGLPHLSKEIMPMEMAITIEMADLADLSQTNLLDKPQENKEKEPDTPPKDKPPVYNKSDTAPDLLSPQVPDIDDIEEDIPEPEKIKLMPNIEEDIPEPEKINPKPLEKKAVIKKPPKPRNKPRRKPNPKPVEPKAENKPKDQKDFTSLLKSLTPDEPSETPQSQAMPEDNSSGQLSQVADFSTQMTRSELDDLNRGVQNCWNVNAGGKDAHELKVELMVFVNPDRKVREVQIMDSLRYSSDSHFKAAAEAARRALLNERCSTLNLPPEKYERWKKFRYIFDPSQML